MKISLKYMTNTLLLSAGYYLVNVLSIRYYPIYGQTPFWMLSGVTVAVLFLGGYRYLPVIVVGIAATVGLESMPLSLFVTSLIMQLGEAVIAVYLLHHFARFSTDFDHVIDIFYLLFAAIPAILFIGLVKAASIFISGAAWSGETAIVVLMLMITHLINILVIFPVILVWKRPYPAPFSTTRKFEVLFLFLSAVLIQNIDFTIFDAASLWYAPLIYLSTPFGIWSILRFRTHGAVGVSLFIFILLATTTFSFVDPSLMFVELLMRAFVIGISSVVSFIVAAVLAEQKRNESALRQSEKKQQEQAAFSRAVMDALGESVYVVNMDDGKIEYANPVFADTVGVSVDELIGQFPKNFIPDAYKQKYDEAIVLRKEGRSSSYESALQAQDGRITPVLVTGSPRWENGRVTGSVIINTDLTERNRAQEMVHLVVSKSPNTTFLIDEQGIIIFANDLVQQMFGYSSAELIGQSFHILIPDHVREIHHKYEKMYYASPVATEFGAGHIMAAKHRDGTIFQTEIALNPVDTDDGKMVLATIIDVTPRVKMEQKLQQRETYLRILVEQAPIGIVVADMDGTITDANPFSIKLLGSPSQEQTIGLNLFSLSSLVDTGLTDIFRAVINGRDMIETESWYTSIWGKRSYFFIRVVPHYDENNIQIGIFILLEDMTARIQAEEAMLHLQKTESLGILAGGIAHDFNNLLVAIMAQSSLALLKMDDDAPARHNVERSNKAAKRAAELTNQLLAYSGRGRFHIAQLDINALIEENKELFAATVPKHIQLVQYLAPNLPKIEADIAQIQQVIMNLIINAAEAIGSDDGEIQLITRVKTVDAADSQYGEYVTGLVDSGRYVQLSVLDNGPGMDAGTMKKIFDPFFSTKESGHGLGLAAVLGIIKGHNGALSIRSDENGTFFTLLFPISEQTGVIPVIPIDKGQEAGEGAAAGGKVLIIDDEEFVCMAAADILEMEEIDTVWAHNGRDGAASYQEQQDDIAVVILDLSMPGWNGQQTLQALRTINPDVRVILSSGYSKEESVLRFDDQVPSDFLSKPYNADDLIEIVKKNWPHEQLAMNN